MPIPPPASWWSAERRPTYQKGRIRLQVQCEVPLALFRAVKDCAGRPLHKNGELLLDQARQMMDYRGSIACPHCVLVVVFDVSLWRQILQRKVSGEHVLSLDLCIPDPNPEPQRTRSHSLTMSLAETTWCSRALVAAALPGGPHGSPTTDRQRALNS